MSTEAKRHPDSEVAFVSAVAAHQRETNRISHEEHAHEYYQTSLLSALMQGVYDGDVTVGSLLKHGDFGLGTFNALDGEMIVIDAKVYQLFGDGTAKQAPADLKTPYAAVIPFEPDFNQTITGTPNKLNFEAQLDQIAASLNLFYAIRVDGRFPRMRIRNVVKQTPPYKPLLEAVSEQALHELTDVEGTMLGFRCPDYAAGIGVPGYHLHFIAADRSKGGHVMDYTIASGTLKVDHTSSLHLELPETQAFNAADLASGSSASNIHKAESGG